MGVLQLLAGFYQEAPDGKPLCGDIYWVPVPFVDEVPRVLEVVRADPRDHANMDFEVRQVHSQHFTQRAERLPLKLFPLESTEEALISRAKLRPAIVLCRSCVTDAGGALSAADQRHAKQLTRECFVVAPMFSTATPNEPGTFMPPLVARIRAMNYAHLACFPRLGSNEPVPGEIVRLDRVQATHLSRGCRRTGYRLHAEARELLQSQFSWFVNGTIAPVLADIIELCRSAGPDEPKAAAL